MWVGRVSIQEMRKRSRWRVELFCDGPAARRRAAFRWVALRELVSERQEALDPQDHPNHLFNYVGLENIQPVTGDLVSFEPKPGRQVRSKSKVFRNGDVLYGRLRPYLNKVYLAGGAVSNGICSGEFFVLVHRPEVVRPQLLRALLASAYVHPFVAALQTGSALPRLELEDLLEIEVPLPSLNKQVVYERFLEAQTRYRREIAAQLSRLPSAVLDGLVRALESGGKPTLPKPDDSQSPEGIDSNPLPAGEFSVRRREPRVRGDPPQSSELGERAH